MITRHNNKIGINYNLNMSVYVTATDARNPSDSIYKVLLQQSLDILPDAYDAWKSYLSTVIENAFKENPQTMRERMR